MTVISMIPSDTPYLPTKVTEVPKEVLRNFSHSKKVGNYLLGNTLGEGSFAKVKEALHIPTGERVAVKIIDKKKSREDSYVRKNLRREGKILQMIHHPNVVHLLEIMETQNSYYLVTELCRGGDLMDHISKKRKLPEAEVKRYIRQIVSAVDYLHRLGILHRDLKIENLLLDEYRDIKIIDFGLSNCVKLVASEEGSKVQELCVTQCGSPAYAAPELLGRKKYGSQVDVWSINDETRYQTIWIEDQAPRFVGPDLDPYCLKRGVNMYAMLTGNLPFTVEPFNIKALHCKMVNGQMNPMPDGISKECKDIIKKFLNPDPTKRISVEEILKHPWIAEAHGVPLVRAPCPNKVKTDSLENSILKHMSDNQGFRIGEIIRYVTGNIPSSATAMYYLILRRLNKHNGNQRGSGRISAADNRLLQRAQQDFISPVKNITETNNNNNNKRATPYDHAPPSPVSRVVTNHVIKSVRNAVNTQQKLKEAVEKSEKKPGTESKDVETEAEVFTDISKTTNNSSVRADSPSRLKKGNFSAKHAPTYFPSVATKYAVTRRKTSSTNQVTVKYSKDGDITDVSTTETCRATPAFNGSGHEDIFRKRVSSFPTRTQRPGSNQRLYENGDELIMTKSKDAKHSPETIHKAELNKMNAKHEQNLDRNSSPVSSRAMPNYRNHVESMPVGSTSPTPKTNNQYLLLYKKQQMHRKSAQGNHTNTSSDVQSSKGSVTEDDTRASSVTRPLLSRPARNNKIPRAKLVNHNMLHEDMPFTKVEHVSEVSSTSTRPLSSRNTNVSSCSTTPVSPALPNLPK